MILAPGESGALPKDEFSVDQSQLYSALTPARRATSPTGCSRKDYLSEKFEEAPAPIQKCPEEARPKRNNCLVKKNRARALESSATPTTCPTSSAKPASDAMFGSGWVAAEDRGLLLQLGLGPANVAALSPPGLNAFELLLTGRSFTPSKEAEEYVGNQVRRCAKTRAPRRTGDRRSRILGRRRQRLRGTHRACTSANVSSPMRSQGSRSSARSSATAAAAKSRTLELPRQPRGQVRRNRRPQDLPRPA